VTTTTLHRRVGEFGFTISYSSELRGLVEPGSSNGPGYFHVTSTMSVGVGLTLEI